MVHHGTPQYTTVYHVVYYTMVHHAHHGTPCGILHHVHHSTPCTPGYTTIHHSTPHGVLHHIHHAHHVHHGTPCGVVHHAMVYISVKSHVTTHLSQSEDSILSNLSNLVRNHEISPKMFPEFKEQSCYNSSAKNTETCINLIRINLKIHSVTIDFFENFWRTQVLFVGPLISLF